MEPREAAEIVALMRGTWPRFAPDEIADRLWMEDLCELSYELAERTWRYLRDRDERPPPWARFSAVYADRAPVWSRALDAQRALASPARAALPAGKTETWAEAHARRQAFVEKQRLERSMQLCREATEQRADQPAPVASGVDPCEPLLTYAQVYAEPGEPVSSTERPPNDVLPPSEPEQGAWDVDGLETV